MGKDEGREGTAPPPCKKFLAPPLAYTDSNWLKRFPAGRFVWPKLFRLRCCADICCQMDPYVDGLDWSGKMDPCLTPDWKRVSRHRVATLNNASEAVYWVDDHTLKFLAARLLHRLDGRVCWSQVLGGDAVRLVWFRGNAPGMQWTDDADGRLELRRLHARTTKKSVPP